jgi:hypothetical protein
MELSLKPSSAKVKDYYDALNQFGQLNISLIGQVITVSLETVKIVNALPDLGLPKTTLTGPSEILH